MKATTTLEPDEAWAALLAKDPSYDGAFVYAVATTGIYCRPVCPSRRPARKNVTFFAASSEARMAGYRACRRCRPDTPEPSAPEKSVQRAREYLDDHLDESVTLSDLGRIAEMSPHHLQRTFKKLLGVSPREYVQMRRTDRFKGYLREGQTVSRATYEAGYGSGSRVYEQARAQLGMTPGAYRRGGAAQTIRYTIATSPLGKLLVGATDQGVSVVALGKSDDDVLAHLAKEYPNAQTERADGDLTEWVTLILEYLAGTQTTLDLPLALEGTLFQYRVWRALQDIPYGETRSYGDIAKAIGAPTAARAVARACASNPAALVVPCHRIVRGDGGMGGYRWGTDRKERLLHMETAPPDQPT